MAVSEFGEKTVMARLGLNVFNLIALVSAILLVGYFWFVFLPAFELLPEYTAVRNIVIIITILLLAVSGIQVFLIIREEET